MTFAQAQDVPQTTWSSPVTTYHTSHVDRLAKLMESPAQPVAESSRGPIIPEPMVFDMVRPLGARRGEFEINTLGLIPLKRARGTPAIEWAPEVEWAIRDNLAIEFELPMGDGKLEAYKFAVQYTFGHSFEERFIHGTQGIYLYDRDRKSSVITLLYLAGVRLDEKYSLLTMVGARTEFAGNTPARRVGFLVDPLETAPEATTIGREGGSRTETLFNLILFREVSETFLLGFEVNYARGLEGEGSLLLMPQVHWDFMPNWEIQFGVGMQAVSGDTIGLAAFRLIRTW
jgi:hypothetical protein